jgi:uncharacterized protein YcgI (DUF1989 family)
LGVKNLNSNSEKVIPELEAEQEMREDEKAFYDEVAKRSKEWKLEEEFIIPKSTAKAFIVKRGQIFRIVEIEGPQCADLNIFNMYNPKERFHQGRTRTNEGAHPSLYAYMWSNLRPPRPMLVIIEDTAPPLSHELLFGGGENAGCHSTDHSCATPEKNPPNCTDNFIKAVKPFGIGPEGPHEPFNIWMKTGLIMDSPIHALTIYATTSKKGDYISFFAFMDCIIAISACHGGGFESWDRENPRPAVQRPLKIEIYNPEFVRITKTFYRIA